ncbi:sensor histidine kinase [Gottfriedia acidiceleris]|uniref:histidine kinase n=1 Tax=Gottfriedia acidiceleris TaxID=371036 RepID=A0ABY4JNT3_9BACI|nr:HAMP domain-containing sensor histidine kinase [Gottfriedia acidiceleris]UPM55501.1 HAMP domain-containing histidine kinase [Gottfriedia acidiceleris]
MKIKTNSTLKATFRVATRISILLAFVVCIMAPITLVYRIHQYVLTEGEKNLQRVERVNWILQAPDTTIGKELYLSTLTVPNSVLVLNNYKTKKVRAFNPNLKISEQYHSELAFKKVNEKKMRRIYLAVINKAVEVNTYLVKKGFFTDRDYVRVKKFGPTYYVEAFQYISAKSYNFNGIASFNTNIPLEFQSIFRITLTTFVVSLVILSIISFIAAFFAMRDVFVPLDRALKKLVVVNKGMFNERISFEKHKNNYVDDLSEQINIILHRAERAILSQQQSAREITHQIRTPLTSIQQSVDYFRMFGFHNATKREERLNIIELQVERIASMINKIITLSKLEEIQTENTESYDLSVHIKQYLFRNKTVYENITFEQSIQEEIYTFIPFENILQIMDSLIENAVKYSYEPKKIYIELSTVDSKIHICVRNRGVEIPKDEIDKIFEHSYRAKAVQKNYVGTGLGLAVVKRFVEIHHGEIYVTSEKNITNFVITLPNQLIGKE